MQRLADSCREERWEESNEIKYKKLQKEKGTTSSAALSWIQFPRIRVSPARDIILSFVRQKFWATPFRTRLLSRSKALCSPCFTILFVHIPCHFHSSQLQTVLLFYHIRTNLVRSWLLLAMRVWRSRWDKDHSCSCPSFITANRTTQSFVQDLQVAMHTHL